MFKSIIVTLITFIILSIPTNTFAQWDGGSSDGSIGEGNGSYNDGQIGGCCSYGDNGFSYGDNSGGGYGDSGSGGYGDSGSGYSDNGGGGGTGGSYSDSGGGGDPTKSIGGSVFHDKLRDTQYDAGDSGIQNQTVELWRVGSYNPGPCDENGCQPGYYDPDTRVGTAVTDSVGFYLFPNTAPGDYRVFHTTEPIWSGWVRTTPNNQTVSINGQAGRRIRNFGVDDNDPPPPPVIDPITKWCDVQTAKALISWNPTANTSSYTLHRSSNNGVTWSYVRDIAQFNTKVQYTDIQPENNQTYWYRVTANGSNGTNAATTAYAGVSANCVAPVISTTTPSCQPPSNVSTITTNWDPYPPVSGPPPLGNGLVSYWNMDEAGGTNIADVKGSNHGTTQSAGSVSTPGVNSTAHGRNFDKNTNQYIVINDSGSLAVNTYTVSAWVRPTSFNGWVSIFNRRKVIGNEYSYIMEHRGDDPGKIACNIKTSNGQNNYYSDERINLNAWNHVACTYDGANVTIYVNGIAKSFPHTGTVANPAGVETQIGRNLTAGPTGTTWDGGIDEVGVWNKALLPAEIAQLRAGANPIGTGSVSPGPTTNFARYEIQRSMNAQAYASIGGNRPTTPTNYDDSAVSYPNSYRYQVRSVNTELGATSTSPWSNPSAAAPANSCDSNPPILTWNPLSLNGADPNGCFEQTMVWPRAMDVVIEDRDPPTPPSGVNSASVQVRIQNMTTSQVLTDWTNTGVTNPGGGSTWRYMLAQSLPLTLDNNYRISFRASDNATPPNQSAALAYNFRYVRSCYDWIQTRGGNVHSEGQINVPGGP